MRLRILAVVAAATATLLGAGCATIATDAGQVMRVETYSETDDEVKGAQCRLENDRGVYNLISPGAVTVRKSSNDLTVNCVAPNRADAKAVVTSRVGAGMFGNIIFGGGVGAIIDHSKGTAYNYPTWLQLVFGRTLLFDRQEFNDGAPSPAFEVRDSKREPYVRPGSGGPAAAPPPEGAAPQK